MKSTELGRAKELNRVLANSVDLADALLAKLGRVLKAAETARAALAAMPDALDLFERVNAAQELVANLKLIGELENDLPGLDQLHELCDATGALASGMESTLESWEQLPDLDEIQELTPLIE